MKLIDKRLKCCVNLGYTHCIKRPFGGKQYVLDKPISVYRQLCLSSCKICCEC